MPQYSQVALIERKAILPPDDRIAYVQHIQGHGSQYFDLIREQGLLRRASCLDAFSTYPVHT
jgi:hypothetical protein